MAARAFGVYNYSDRSNILETGDATYTNQWDAIATSKTSLRILPYAVNKPLHPIRELDDSRNNTAIKAVFVVDLFNKRD